MTDPTANRQSLTVRDLRFRPAAAPKSGDPVARAWFIALSCSFPRGEAMFIEGVKQNRDGAPPELAAQIRDFIRQEVNHSREHIAFNRTAAETGYDLSRIDAHVERTVGQTLALPPHLILAVTIALEHFTAMFAHQFLKNPDLHAEGMIGGPELWQWHAVEEIEHKGVAFDTWNHATRDWNAIRRWAVRAMVMGDVTVRFLHHRTRAARDLLAQDGITGWRPWWGQMRYLWGTPGMLRRIFPAWLAYFRPGFHPWDQDDRALMAKWDDKFRAASPAEAAE
jgi:uncharacterized protein